MGGFMKKGILVALFLSIVALGTSTFADMDNQPEFRAMREMGGGGGPRLGLVLSKINPHLREALHIDSGVVVDRVLPGSAAEKGGIQEGDIILRMNGQNIEDMQDVRRLLQSSNNGKTVSIDLVRDGKPMTVNVTPEVKEAKGMRFGSRNYIGVELQELNKDLGSYFNADSGALIVRVQPESPAAKAGLQAGDVITNFGGKKVESPEDVMNSMEGLEDGQTSDITVLRHGKQMTLNVQPEQRDDERGFMRHWNMPDMSNMPDMRDMPDMRNMVPDQDELRGDIEKEMADVKQQLQELKQYKFDELRKEMDELRQELKDLKKQK
jgi:C-terminal processing protease CtpA/Prc